MTHILHDFCQDPENPIPNPSKFAIEKVTEGRLNDEGVDPLKAWTWFWRWEQAIETGRRKLFEKVLAACATYGKNSFAVAGCVLRVRHQTRFMFDHDPEWIRLSMLLKRRERELTQNLKHQDEEVDAQNSNAARRIHLQPTISVTRNREKYERAISSGRKAG